MNSVDELDMDIGDGDGDGSNGKQVENNNNIIIIPHPKLKEKSAPEVEGKEPEEMQLDDLMHTSDLVEAESTAGKLIKLL